MAEFAVMVVDDEEGIRESLSGIFEDEGYSVLTASSGEEALNILKEQSPDLMLLDVWLPGIDGIETLKEIKNLKAGSSRCHDLGTWKHRTCREGNKDRRI